MKLKQAFPDYRINSSLQDGLREIGAWRYSSLFRAVVGQFNARRAWSYNEPI
jgi:hypothetical protein